MSIRSAVLVALFMALPLGPAGAQPAADAQPVPAAEPPAAAPTSAPKPDALSLQIVRVHFRGNRKVEDDALRVNMRTQAGANLTQDMLRDDVRSIWKMGFFEDVQVESTSTPQGLVVVFVLKEKPSIRKIYVTGHEELGLSKINEVLDIKKEQILDLAKIKKNVDKIREQYIQRGYYMAEVNYELRRDSASDVDVYFRIRENAKVEVRRVNFVGNHGASDDDLRGVMLTQEGDLFSLVTSSGTYREDVFQRDLLLVQSYYWDRGFVNVKLGEPQLELSPDRRSLYITLSVEEGQQYRVGKIDVHGDLLESKEFYLSRFGAKPGDVFNRSKLTQDVQGLTDFYRDRGYAYPNTVPNTLVDEKNRIVDVIYEVQKGALVYIDRINIRGNTKTRDKVIRRELRIAEGDLYNQSRIDYSKRRANQLGFFDRVDVSQKRSSSDDQMELNVEVGERQTGAFQIGAGFSSVESFIVQAQISQNNLFGRGQLLQLQAQVSGFRQLFMLQFEEPYFLDTNWTFGFNIFNQLRYYRSFDRRATGSSLTWGYMLMDNLRLYLTYTLQDVSVRPGGRGRLFSGGQSSPLPPGSLANLLRSGIASSTRVSLSHDTRDNRLFPHSGWQNTFSIEVADKYLLSEAQYTRYEGVVRYFYPILGPLVLRLKLDVGLVSSRDKQGVPIAERYFVGGIYDIRGFQPLSLGPQIRAPFDQAPDAQLQSYPVGGNMSVVGKAEVEFPIFEKVGIRGVVFTDAGNAYNLENQYCRLRPFAAHASVDPCRNVLDLTTLRTSWGFGFRWFSPIGPLRFEWGFPFYTLPGEQSVVFEFTIGSDL